MGAATSISFRTNLDSKTRAKFIHKWKKAHTKAMELAAPSRCTPNAKKLWAKLIDKLSSGGFIPFVDKQTWQHAMTAYVSLESGCKLPYSKAKVQKFVTASCFHLKWCDGKSRNEAERVLRHTSHAAFIVRRITQEPKFWKGAEAYYYDLKRFGLEYAEKYEEWLEQDVYGGDALSEERLLGLAHNQFDLDPKAAVRHTDVLPQIPLDKTTMKPFKNDYRFIVPLHMLSLCIRPIFEEALQKFCAMHKCQYQLRRQFRVDELVSTLLSKYFEEESPRAASNTEVVKAVIHGDTGALQGLMAKAAKYFGPFLQITNEFETASVQDDK